MANLIGSRSDEAHIGQTRWLWGMSPYHGPVLQHFHGTSPAVLLSGNLKQAPGVSGGGLGGIKSERNTICLHMKQYCKQKEN